MIGGIENKLFNLILVTVILLSAAFLGLSLYQTRLLTDVSAETQSKQQAATAQVFAESQERQQTATAQVFADTHAKQRAAITAITGDVIEQMIRGSLTRVTQLRAEIIDEMYRTLQTRVALVAEYTRQLFSSPAARPLDTWPLPQADSGGKLTAAVLMAERVDPRDPQTAREAGLLATMGDMIISVCEAFGTDNIYVGLPSGVHLSVGRYADRWVGPDGAPIPYDPAPRYWFRAAQAAGTMVFSDVEIDANTGSKNITCSVPVYDGSGTLVAVVGADLYLTDIQAWVEHSDTEGAFVMILNQDGHVIFAPPALETVIQARTSSEAQDLRESDNEALASLVRDGLRANTDIRTVDLDGVTYYMTAAPVPTVGWSMLIGFSREVAMRSSQVLEAEHDRIQAEAIGSYEQQTADLRDGTILDYETAIQGIQASAVTNYRSKIAAAKRVLIAAIAVLSLLMLAGALTVGRRIVRPLNRMTRAIAEADEENPEFSMEEIYRTGDEIEVLATSFARVSHQTVKYIDWVKKVTAEKERIGTELHMAKQIQEGMLPSIFPAFPDRPEFDLHASMNPAKEVGGDFYDFFLIDDDHLALVMADVSGKGVPGALFMMASKIILQSCAMQGGSPAEILTMANRAICSRNTMEMFVTAWIGILEISTGKLTAGNAGHEYPAIRRAGGAFELYRDRHGFVVGGMDGVKYREYTLHFSPGDKLFLYTDGVPEATDAAGGMFGTERMLDALNRHGEEAPREILAGMHAEVDAFVGEAEQFDDLTMLCIEYRGRAALPPEDAPRQS